MVTEKSLGSRREDRSYDPGRSLRQSGRSGHTIGSDLVGDRGSPQPNERSGPVNAAQFSDIVAWPPKEVPPRPFEITCAPNQDEPVSNTFATVPELAESDFIAPGRPSPDSEPPDTDCAASTG